MPEGQHFGHRQRQIALRLLLTYLVPLVVLAVYFQFQYRNLLRESRKSHLEVIAENQANLLDLFLRERVVNLRNTINDPKMHLPPTREEMHRDLVKLVRDSYTFVDLGFFDEKGNLVAYDGPLPDLKGRDYSNEPWFRVLSERRNDFVITDIYLGFRNKPHFTIGVSREIDGTLYIMRATLDPIRFHEFLSSLEGAGEIKTVLVNRDGEFQLGRQDQVPVGGRISPPPPHSPRVGSLDACSRTSRQACAYAWLKTTDWALIAQWAKGRSEAGFAGIQTSLIAVSSAVVLALFAFIIVRAHQVAVKEAETESTKAVLTDQLQHAARLASIGELAAGVAHEINNPLAIIAEEVGLMKDQLDPALGMPLTETDIRSRLGNIHDAVFRCRDITRKLLSFVRKGDTRLESCEVNSFVEEVIGGFFEHEMTVSNIRLERSYGVNLPRVLTDRNQIEQVLINIVKNGVDALGESGTILVETAAENGEVLISIHDTGCGMDAIQLEKIFLPFYTTKDVGKGTGLGLSVSYGIVKSLGGRVEVESTPGKGSSFTVILPAESGAANGDGTVDGK